MRCWRRSGSVDAVWHLGDVVGYGPDPDGVVARLSGIGAVGVAGNHDAAAAGGDDIDWFNHGRAGGDGVDPARIAPATRDWLAAAARAAGRSRCSSSSTAARATRPGSTS